MPGRSGAVFILCLFAKCASSFSVGKSQTCSSEGGSGECTAQTNQQFLHAEGWREKLGWTSAKLTSAEIMGVRGVITTEGMKANEVVVKQPFDTVINGNSMMWRSPFPEEVSQKFWSKTDSIRKVVCRTAVEIGKGPASQWAGWIGHLPRKFDTLPHWSKAELEELQNPDLTVETYNEVRDPADAYSGLKETTPNTTITWEDWHWAWTLVGSRSFSFTYQGGMNLTTLAAILVGAGVLYMALRIHAPTLAWWIMNGAIILAIGNKAWGILATSWVDSVAMLPLMDDFNHAVHPNLLMDYKAGASSLQMVAVPDGIAPGDEVFISYGNHTNDHYLMIYGFTIPDNPNEKYLLNDLDRKVLQHATVDPDRLKYMNNTALMQNLRTGQCWSAVITSHPSTFHPSSWLQISSFPVGVSGVDVDGLSSNMLLS
ncbi:hypothetical protein WJX84_001461 [Apatococcus fuscideae]|uniref:SET domain-containing protein n=1 Tax=Apatococcus fuscideae TaxID=2026836 RepID=A0AAW1RXT2_9CHLO